LDLSTLNPNRLKFLASLGRRHTNQALRRLAPERRYPILLAFVSDAHAEITDEAIDLFDGLLAQADACSRRELDEFRKRASRAIGEKVRLFREVGEILLDPKVSDSKVRAAVLGRVGSVERLEELVEESGRLERPLDDNYFLDEILGNETELPIAEHVVDTHGFTEVVFTLFAALGLRFSPASATSPTNASGGWTVPRTPASSLGS
jgi:Tn3 transposase DDE domain